MIFFGYNSVPDDIDGDFPVELSEDADSLRQLCAFDFDQILSAVLAAADVLQQRNRSGAVFQFQHAIDFHASSGRDMIEDKAILDAFNI